MGRELKDTGKLLSDVSHDAHLHTEDYQEDVLAGGQKVLSRCAQARKTWETWDMGSKP